MSQLPQKKKTVEELAALRESLGIDPEGPPAGAPGVMGAGPLPPPQTPPQELPRDPAPLPEVKSEPKKSVPSEEPEPEAEPLVLTKSGSADEPVVLETEEEPEVKAKLVGSFRKSESLTVDKPKKVVSKDSGKLPSRRQTESERHPLEKPATPVSRDASNLPAHKHSDQELAKLRHAPVATGEGPAVQIANPTAGPQALLGIYGLGILLMLIAGGGASAAAARSLDLPFDWLRDAVALPNYSMILFGTMAAGVAVMLLGAAWIFFKKPLSQHHSAILTIIAVLVLVFGTLYLFPGLHGA